MDLYRLDLHVHTSRHSPCAEALKPGLLPDRMRQAGIHGVVLAEHDRLWDVEELRNLNRLCPDLRLFRGVEVSTSQFHFVVIGLESMDGIRAGCTPEHLVERAACQGAAVILAHHHLTYSRKTAPGEVERLPDGVDAIEVYSTMTRDDNAREAMRLAQEKGWHPVAGSDAHAIENVGHSYTALESMPADERELAHMVQIGLGSPVTLAQRS